MLKKFLDFKIGNVINLFIYHFIFLSISFLCVYIFSGTDNAISCILGGLVSILSSFLFFVIYFFGNVDFTCKTIVKKFYIAGFVKFFSFILFTAGALFLGVANILLFLLFLLLFQTTIWVGFIFFLKECEFL